LYRLEDDERLNRKAYFGWMEGDPPLNEHFKTRKHEKYSVPYAPRDVTK
jgi:hypothetical protein